MMQSVIWVWVKVVNARWTESEAIEELECSKQFEVQLPVG